MEHHLIEQRIAEVLDLVELLDRRKDHVRKFSGGMKRRLEIARGLMHRPKLLFLDEPTLGLDPQTRSLMWEDVLRMRDEEGVTVFLTTHYMDEAEYAERIAIIDYGSIVALDSPDALKRSIGADTVEVSTVDDALAANRLAAAGLSVRRGEHGIVVFTANGEGEVARIITTAGVPVRNVHVHRPTLDDVFLHYTGREIRESHAEPAMSSRLRARFARHR